MNCQYYLFGSKGGGTITLVEIGEKPDTRSHRYKEWDQCKGGSRQKWAIRVIDISHKLEDQ